MLNGFDEVVRYFQKNSYARTMDPSGAFSGTSVGTGQVSFQRIF